MKRKVGFFGGTFDPIHFGHLNLAIELMEAHSLDEVWFCPAHVNPNKQDHHSALLLHRMHMVDLAIGSCPHFKLLDIESRRKGISYTGDTLKELIEAEKTEDHPTQFFLLLSDETASEFAGWYQPLDIVKMVPILVGSRTLSALALPKNGDPSINHALEQGWTRTKCMEISSTEIRDRLHKKLYCGHLVPEKVLDYIYENELYYSI